VTAWRLALAALLAAAATAAAAAAADWSQAQPAGVVTTEYRFSPDKLVFRRGVAYRLHLENHGTETHEFTAPAFFKAVELGNPDVLNPDRTEIVLHPGERKDLYFLPTQAGQFRLICSDHDWAGMKGEITVE
jgi:uncharacterized cupredoxin-like copper-binding protein